SISRVLLELGEVAVGRPAIGRSTFSGTRSIRRAARNLARGTSCNSPLQCNHRVSDERAQLRVFEPRRGRELLVDRRPANLDVLDRSSRLEAFPPTHFARSLRHGSANPKCLERTGSGSEKTDAHRSS